MRFGPTPLDEAVGAVLAHAVSVGAAVFRKGRVLSAADVQALSAHGLDSVIAARLDPDDIAEDAAADRVAKAVCGPGLTPGAAFTGRVNLFAAAPGVLTVDTARVDALNLTDEAITLATLPPYAVLQPQQMAATIKIIPFAVPAAALSAIERSVHDGGPLLALHPFRPRPVVLIQTILPSVKPSVLDKTVEVTRNRLSALGAELIAEHRTAHRAEALAPVLRDALDTGAGLVLIAGASAITDRADVLPSAITATGGVVEHLGMPVDPGNLFLLGRVQAVPVLGLPGCARSPKVNGFDWVLERLLADLAVTRSDIMRMGVGGLLTEIPSRPLPRAAASPAPEPPRAPRVAVIVLAAGRSTRMGGPNKLLADLHGRPLVAVTVDAMVASQARPVIVVTGHQADQIRVALGDRPVTLVHNPDAMAGLSTSLRAGLAALPEGIDAAIIALADMPRVSPKLIDRLIAAYAPLEGRWICVPTVDGKRGNPVLWDRRFFADMAAVAGDVGARHLLGLNEERLCEVAADDDGAVTDVDTPDALAAVRSIGMAGGEAGRS